ncbi:uncharacterized protein LOC128217624 [Mya arenaria]|uniref:uncharacterized protein LOC128217624 n=1 Tax=Mya arenaria TaxID=6604 RepID=UPI0022E763A5|nr:uncharacterized protein LOC128217624 [Mya arenaria]
MRIVHFKRNCVNYLFSFALLSVMLTLYIIGLKQSKQARTNFNLKQPKKIKRGTNLEHMNHIRHDFKRETNKLTISTKSPYFDSPRGRAPGASKREPDRSGELGTIDRKGQYRGPGPQGALNRYLGKPGVDEQNVESRGSGPQGPTDGKGRGGDKEGQLPVYIVEEHHEVLPYWFSAATRGLVPKSGNTLVHVDGHSDMAPPVNVPGYPFFKWPAHRQIKYLMQSNDVFIQASAMANFINRLIWVWPDWDLTNHDADYTMGTLSLGTVNIKKVNARRNSKSRDRVASQFSPFCMCMNNGTDVECWSLFDVERGNMSRERGEYKLRSDLCVIKKLLIFEELHESKAVAFFKNPKWSGRNESIVLDIDEDFYGCTYAVEPLLNTNFSLERLRRLNGIIVDFLCPLNASHEKASDIFLVDLVSSVRNNRACTINQELKNSSACKEILDLKIIDHFSNKLRLLILSKSITTCQSKGTGVNQFIKDLVIFLAKMRIKQLRALQSVGFCASTSPRTLNKDNRVFVVCSGANTPEESMVLVHRPTEKEITRRTIFLRSILRNIMKKSPGFVTIARSVRDGYTPRENFERIERDVLTALNTTSSRRLNIYYDKELLGGKPGWPARHKV